MGRPGRIGTPKSTGSGGGGAGSDTTAVHTLAEAITILGGQVGGLPLLGLLAADLNFTQSNTTLQNITGMSFPIGASATEIWLVETYQEMTAADVTMDVKFGWATMPTSATMVWGAAGGVSTNPGYGEAGVTGATSPLALLTATQTLSTGTLAGTAGYSLVGKVYGGGTAGTIQLMACQNASMAAQLTAKAGSWLRATKVRA